MEQNQAKKFVCKFCNKRYPCGKSLGGHIRTHMNNNENSGEAKERAEISINKLLSRSSNDARNMKRAAEAEAVGQSATYDLRENPKKSKRFSDSGNTSLLKEMVCKECGKGFQSKKALCGHMACHSEKERVFQKFEDEKLVVDSQSDTETSSTPGKRRRSKRISCNNKPSGVYSNGSSSVSVIDEQEREDVAMCLMMLSRDHSGRKKGRNSVADSSDNNSVVLEAKSSSIDVRITIKNDMKCVNKQGDDNIKLKKSCEPGPCSETSDSGYFRNGTKKVELEPDVECKKKLKVKSRSGFGGFDAKPAGKISSKFKCVKTEFRKAAATLVHGRCEDDSFATDNTKVTKFSNGNAEKRLGSSKKNKGHECPFCFKVFKSGQALGGHKRSHFVGGIKETALAIKQEDSPDDMPLPALIDLNLPAPVEEDAIGNSGFIPW